MHFLKRILGLSGLTGIVAAMAFAVPAQAGNPDAAAVCTVNGFADTSGVDVLANTGDYTFDSSGALGGLELSCLTELNLGNGMPNQFDGLVVGIVDISATSIGTFSNIVCGTGVADSTSNDVTSASAIAITQGWNDAAQLEAFATKAATESHLDYRVTFAATNGPLVFAGTPFIGDEPGDAEGGGLVHITDPTPGEIDPLGSGLCTTDFAVQGVIAGTLDDDPASS